MQLQAFFCLSSSARVVELDAKWLKCYIFFFIRNQIKKKEKKKRNKKKTPKTKHVSILQIFKKVNLYL